MSPRARALAWAPVASAVVALVTLAVVLLSGAASAGAEAGALGARVGVVEMQAAECRRGLDDIARLVRDTRETLAAVAAELRLLRQARRGQ